VNRRPPFVWFILGIVVIGLGTWFVAAQEKAEKSTPVKATGISISSPSPNSKHTKDTELKVEGYVTDPSNDTEVYGIVMPIISEPKMEIVKDLRGKSGKKFKYANQVKEYRIHQGKIKQIGIQEAKANAPFEVILAKDNFAFDDTLYLIWVYRNDTWEIAQTTVIVPK
jgi:hypothetical protein